MVTCSCSWSPALVLNIEILSEIMPKRIAGVPVFGGLLILSVLIIHNLGCIEGSEGEAVVKSSKPGQQEKAQEQDEERRGESKSKSLATGRVVVR